MLRFNRFIWAAIFVFIVSIGGYVIQKKTDGKPMYSEEIIRDYTQSMKPSLVGFLNVANNLLDSISPSLNESKPDTIDYQRLNQQFARFIDRHASIRGVVIAGQDYQYIFGREKDSWISTYDSLLTDSITTWRRFDSELNEMSSWEDAYVLVIQTLTLKTILNRSDETKARWFVVEPTNESRNQIAIHYRNIRDSNDQPIVYALVYNLDEIKKEFEVNSRLTNYALALMEDNEVALFPFGIDLRSKDTSGATLNQHISALLSSDKLKEKKESQTISFLFNGNDYWLQREAIVEPALYPGYSLVASEASLTLKSEKTAQRIWYLFLFGLLISAGLLGFGVFRNVRSKKKINTFFKYYQSKSIDDLIVSGESVHLEFKSSLRWDYREEKVNTFLERVILKTIAAFANGQGGVLLIGIDDDGQILGLSPDLNSLKKNNLDFFELHLRNILNTQFGISFTQKHLHLSFPEINGKAIGKIIIGPANQPVFLQVRDKHGMTTEKFYLRTGNSSQEITSLAELNQYITQRFKK